MTVRTKELIDWKGFSRRLFAIEDADPMYYALARAKLPHKQKQRFMVGWCTYYHPGIAARASEEVGKDFWRYLRGKYETAPRASERRHFRGKAGLDALNRWEFAFPQPEMMVTRMLGHTYFDVRNNARAIPQIGDYFVWKFADVQERVFQIPCDFTDAEKYSPKVPQQGAKLIADKATTAQVYNLIIDHMHDMKAPPWYDRPINMQEAETVCCVYHQYMGEGYTWMSRTAKAVRRLLTTPSEAADALLEGLMNHDGNGISHHNKKVLQEWTDRVLGTASTGKAT